jgi:hypothetical protein
VRVRQRLGFVLTAGVLLATWPALARQTPSPTNDLDKFMARVLQRRDENWKKLHDYILSETERFDITGPGGVRLEGTRREYSWFVRDGYLVRSPVRFDGVTIGDAARRAAENQWLADEKAREERRVKRAAAAGQANPDSAGQAADPAADPAGEQGGLDRRFEPRFVSEAYFLRFRFEAGNYYLVGRERLEGHDVLRIEYYPTGMFGDHGRGRGGEAAGAKPAPATKARTAKQQRDEDLNRRIEQDMNKVSLVTLWVEPNEYQIIRYTFDDVDFGFLPGRWLVRVNKVTASMTMARVLDGVWLPREMAFEGGLTLATGTYQFVYSRQFSDHKKAETGARIRSYREPGK